jgi:hypothetical protein
MAHYKLVHKDGLIDDWDSLAGQLARVIPLLRPPPEQIIESQKIVAPASGPANTKALAFGPTIDILHDAVERGLDLDGLQF